MGQMKIHTKYWLERPRHVWEDGIKMDDREIGLECEDWINLAQERGQRLALTNTEITHMV
jgi:hypothetical protein